MRSLALDCAAKNITLALIENDHIICSFDDIPDQPQSQSLLPIIRDSLDKAGWELSQIQRVYFCKGPGSFTSLRVGLSTLKGLFLGSDISYFEGSSLLFRCLSAQKTGVRTALSLGRGRWAVGYLQKDAFSHELLDDEQWSKLCETDALTNLKEAPRDVNAFLTISQNGLFTAISMDKAGVYYQIEADIG